jgi:hypothetical protein
MTTASHGSNVWVNSDGLVVRFGLEQAKEALAGAGAQAGEMKTVEAVLDSDRMAAFGTNLILGEATKVCLPAGFKLVSATLYVEEAFDSSGDALTLSIGLCEQDGTVIDDDGIDSAIAQAAIDSTSESVACDGALIGTILAKDSFLTVLANTATATAGRGHLVIKLLPPTAA